MSDDSYFYDFSHKSWFTLLFSCFYMFSNNLLPELELGEFSTYNAEQLISFMERYPFL